MKRETTVGATGNSLMSVIPLVGVEILKLKKGDKIEWEFDTQTGEVIVRKKSPEASSK
mgnify:CR=1 FL=1